MVVDHNDYKVHRKVVNLRKKITPIYMYSQYSRMNYHQSEVKLLSKLSTKKTFCCMSVPKTECSPLALRYRINRCNCLNQRK